MNVYIESIPAVLEGDIELFHKILGWENAAFNVLTLTQCTGQTIDFHVFSHMLFQLTKVLPIEVFSHTYLYYIALLLYVICI